MDETANALLKEALNAHDIDTTTAKGWITPYNSLPAIRCFWYQEQGKDTGTLQVEVLLDNEDIIEECFAGQGKEIDGLKNTFQNFLLNSFHVFIEAFWNKQDAEQVTRKTWKINNSNYIAYIGNFGNKAHQGNHPGVPKDAFTQIEEGIMQTSIKPDIVWIRTYVGNINSSERVYEALLNNEDWPEGEKALKNINWPVSDNFYSTRNFLILKKTS